METHEEFLEKHPLFARTVEVDEVYYDGGGTDADDAYGHPHRGTMAAGVGGNASHLSPPGGDGLYASPTSESGSVDHVRDVGGTFVCVVLFLRFQWLHLLLYW